MDKRTILALVLIFLIYWISSQYLWKPAPQPLQNETERYEYMETAEAEVVPYTPIHTPPVQSAVLPDIGIHTYEPTVDVNDKIILENDLIRLTLTNRGGLINQIELKEFVLSDRITPVTLIPEGQAILLTQLSNNIDVNSIIYDHERIGNKIIFTSHHPSIRREFILREGYDLDFIFTGDLAPFDSYSLSLNSGINLTEDSKEARKNIGNTFKFVGEIDRKIENRTVAKLRKGDQSLNGKISWAAVRSKYFVMTLIPENRIMTQSVNIFRVSETLGINLNIRYNNRLSNFSDQYSLYLGPVDYNLLKSYNNGMEHIADMSWAWLRPLARIFKWFIGVLHSFIPNYGIVIMIFSLILKIILTPLTNKSLTSARKMQEIQPLLRELQTKYKNDPRTLQAEMGKLYKEHKVNPVGGCLPLLLQMPIFFALYPVLSSAIEFRQASFFGWLSDLSMPDPYWILPITMGVFMFVQQKMMQPKNQDTSKLDDKQAALMQSQKMMQYFMPPFLVFIFSGLPSGLVLYWTTFNIFSIIQQYHLNKKLKEAR